MRFLQKGSAHNTSVLFVSGLWLLEINIEFQSGIQSVIYMYLQLYCSIIVILDITVIWVNNNVCPWHFTIHYTVVTHHPVYYCAICAVAFQAMTANTAVVALVYILSHPSLADTIATTVQWYDSGLTTDSITSAQYLINMPEHNTDKFFICLYLAQYSCAASDKLLSAGIHWKNILLIELR